MSEINGAIPRAVQCGTWNLLQMQKKDRETNPQYRTEKDLFLHVYNRKITSTLIRIPHALSTRGNLICHIQCVRCRPNTSLLLLFNHMWGAWWETERKRMSGRRNQRGSLSLFLLFSLLYLSSDKPSVWRVWTATKKAAWIYLDNSILTKVAYEML